MSNKPSALDDQTFNAPRPQRTTPIIGKGA
jgi:hypothetical protein